MTKNNTTNHIFFEKIDCEEKAYILGLLWADGYLYKKKNSYITGLTLHKDDSELLSMVLKHLSCDKKIRERKDNCVVFEIYSEKIYKDLENLNVVNNKTIKNLNLPYINPKFMNHFIRGIFDGDGCISKTKNNFTFSISNTENTCNDLVKILKYGKIYKKSNSNICFSFQVRGNLQIQNLFSYLYKDATIYLKRKYDIFINNFKSNTFVEIMNIKPWTKEEEMRLIELYPETENDKLLQIFDRPLNSILGKVRRLKLTKSNKLISKIRSDAKIKFDLSKSYSQCG